MWRTSESAADRASSSAGPGALAQRARRTANGCRPARREIACQLFFPATAALSTVANAVQAISGTASAAAV